MTLRDDLTAEVLERDRAMGWSRVEVSAYDIRSRENDTAWRSQFRRIFFGGDSVTVADTKTRYVAAGCWPVPPGELARAYLRRLPKPFLQRGLAQSLPELTAPLYCRPTCNTRLAYIDLRHAYWEIVRRHPFDAMYLPECDEFVYLNGGISWPHADEIDQDRPLRLSLVGHLFAQHLGYWKGSEFIQLKKMAEWSQPTLRWLTLSTMHAIAQDLRCAFPVHAWLTDACIVDARDAGALQEFLDLVWHFPSHVDATGFGSVRSVTSYAVGDKCSENWRTDPGPLQSFSNLADVDIDYWQAARLDSVSERV
jgi:hypothetical protein